MLAVGSNLTEPVACSALGGSPQCLCLLHLQQGVPRSTSQKQPGLYKSAGESNSIGVHAEGPRLLQFHQDAVLHKAPNRQHTLVCRCRFLRRSSALQLPLQPQIWP